MEVDVWHWCIQQVWVIDRIRIDWSATELPDWTTLRRCQADGGGISGDKEEYGIRASNDMIMICMKSPMKLEIVKS